MARKKEPKRPSSAQEPLVQTTDTVPDLFVRQVSDLALPFPQILADQRESLAPDGPVRIFVP